MGVIFFYIYFLSTVSDALESGQRSQESLLFRNKNILFLSLSGVSLISLKLAGALTRGQSHKVGPSPCQCHCRLVVDLLKRQELMMLVIV